jgi:hypothetical protein
MSDSLNETVIVRLLVLMIWANGVLELEDELDELEPPRPPAADVPPASPLPPLPEELDDELPLDEALLEPEALTSSPGTRLASDAIVPLVGA